MSTYEKSKVMFRPQTQSQPGYARRIAETAFPETCEQDVLALGDGDESDAGGAKMKQLPPGAYSVRPSVLEYKRAAVPVKVVISNKKDTDYGPEFKAQREWADVQTEQAKARRVARGAMDMIAQSKQADAMFNPAPTTTLPTGAAAQTAYSDYARITALMQQFNFGQLVFPDNIAAIAKGVSKTFSTPLFSAFLTFMRAPPPPLAPQQQSKAMFIDLVRRAVMMNNAGVTWEDITGPVFAIPVAGGPEDTKAGGGYTGFDGFPQAKP